MRGSNFRLRTRSLFSGAFVLWCAMALLAATPGCADDCGTAESLCEDCGDTQCERFADAPADHCTEAVTAYENSCDA